ncbi:MAG: pyruvate, phosphate dikinase, partial [bacterium]
VLKIEIKKFEAILQKQKEKKGVVYDIELSSEDLKEVVKDYKRLVASEKKDFPQDPREQLWMSIDTVFGSWHNKRAIEYRRIYKIPDTLGTAVNIQAMVFGNMGEASGTGVAFTRNPSTGEKRLYGEYLLNAQGEDVVAGIRTPKPIFELHDQMHNIYKEFEKITKSLEKHYKDMQDIEFTIENGILYILQTRRGKRTPASSVKIAVDMENEKLITKDEALLRVEPQGLKALLHPQIDPKANVSHDCAGLPASPGVAIGKIVFSPDDAVSLSQSEKVILVREETSPDDIHGMAVSEGILTARGGMTSHAAVVARGMGKPCVCGCEAIRINEKKRELIVDKMRLKEGDEITIDGTSGKVYLRRIPFIIPPRITDELKTLLSWADEKRRLKVRANADDPESARKAREFGAEGIGLCRTEHMFFGEDRLPIMQEMIMAETEEDRRKALDKLLSFQREDFMGIFREMQGLPVTIRLLDPPLHEFLPNHEQLRIELIKLRIDDKDLERQKELEKLLHKVSNLSEMNPMLGLRGCRLGIVYPEISEMQVRAILEAACILKKEEIEVFPEIMIPLVSDKAEFEAQKKVVQEIAEKVFKEQKIKVNYTVGTMIEVPRA